MIAALVGWDGVSIAWDMSLLVTGVLGSLTAGVAGFMVIFLIRSGIDLLLKRFGKRS